jgi:hypothetical protein
VIRLVITRSKLKGSEKPRCDWGLEYITFLSAGQMFVFGILLLCLIKVPCGSAVDFSDTSDSVMPWPSSMAKSVFVTLDNVGSLAFVIAGIPIKTFFARLVAEGGSSTIPRPFLHKKLETGVTS